MDKLTQEALRKSDQETLPGFIEPISSQGSEGGTTPFSLQGGRKIGPSGPGVAPVSPFRSPEGAEALRMSGIYGLFFENSSASVALQQSLENKLLQRMAAYGSMEYDLIWSRWDMPSGPPICALRGLTRHISDNDCSGWATPDCNNHRDGTILRESAKEFLAQGKSHSMSLHHQAAGWATPSAWDCQGSHGGGQGASLRSDAQEVVHGNRRGLLGDKMEKRGALNPDLPRWLMGFQAEWGKSAPMATRSSRKSRQSS